MNRQVSGARRRVSFFTGRKPKYITVLGNSFHRQVASGGQGRAFDIKEIVLNISGKRTSAKTNRWVIKAYHNPEVQTVRARQDYRKMLVLKKRGYPVPAKMKLVRDKGKTYLALSDLAEKGKAQYSFCYYKTLKQAMRRNPQLTRFLGEANFSLLYQTIASFTLKAKRDLGLNIDDSWEIILDKKSRTATPIILDAGMM